MTYKIEDVKVLSVGTEAQDAELCYQGVILENNSSTATVYFREKEADGAYCSAANGFALGPGERMEQILTARCLSLVASGESTDVRMLLVDLG